MKKTWKLIKELSSENISKTNRLTQLNFNNQEITAPMGIAGYITIVQVSVATWLHLYLLLTMIQAFILIKATDKTFSLKIPTVETVYKLLKGINEKKAVGLDNIPNKLLKIAAQVVAPSLRGIFSASVRTGIFCNEWNASRVTPIFKSGSKSNPGNYRPISIIPVIAKIFEEIISDQLCDYLDTNEILTSCQSSFRSLHSTVTAMLEATSDWSMKLTMF